MPHLRLTQDQRPAHRRRVHGDATRLRDAAIRRAQTVAHARVRGEERDADHARASGDACRGVGEGRDGRDAGYHPALWQVVSLLAG